MNVVSSFSPVGKKLRQKLNQSTVKNSLQFLSGVFSLFLKHTKKCFYFICDNSDDNGKSSQILSIIFFSASRRKNIDKTLRELNWRKIKLKTLIRSLCRWNKLLLIHFLLVFLEKSTSLFLVIGSFFAISDLIFKRF